MFLPTSKKELRQLGWSQLDIILVSGDSYIDSPFIGVAVIGRVLAAAGFKVGIIAQPSVNSGEDLTRLGQPKLFWGISGGSVDSMVANYTATGRPRKKDDYTPGGVNNRRPDRAVIVYANLIRQYCKESAPIVLGGIEASLRRVAHYDLWSKGIRRSLLFDAKADYLLYGMAEKSVVELARALAEGKPLQEIQAIRGLCYKAENPPEEALLLPSFAESKADKASFSRMFQLFYENNDPLSARILAQQQDSRYLVQNPPQPQLSSSELDAVHALPYERELHPFYGQHGPVRALETIRFAVTTHRGCYGECNFCAIAVHQGRTVQNRSQQSIIDEVTACSRHPAFKGIIADVGGPTANMYGIECSKKLSRGCCRDKRCIFPTTCPTLPIDHGPQIELLRKLRAIAGIKRIFVASGIRYDLILADRKNGRRYLQELLRHHVSGQMKIAPEHCSQVVLQAMGKPGSDTLLDFIRLFTQLNKKQQQQLFLTYYIIAAHPGCSKREMTELRDFARQELKVIPRQVQVFTPTPSTWSTTIYWTGKDPWSGAPCFVEKDPQAKERQKEILLGALPGRKKSLGSKKAPERAATPRRQSRKKVRRDR